SSDARPPTTGTRSLPLEVELCEPALGDGGRVHDPQNIGGAGLFLAGTTWLWLTPAFASKAVSTSGLTWAITRALCLLTVVGFCVATYGWFTRHEWWEPVALASAALGLVTLIPYWFAATHGGGPSGGD